MFDKLSKLHPVAQVVFIVAVAAFLIALVVTVGGAVVASWVSTLAYTTLLLCFAYVLFCLL